MKVVIDRRQPEPASLCSFIHTMITMCNCAQLNGHEAHIDWTEFRPGFYADETPGLPANMWDWYLEQPMLAERPAGAPTWSYWDKGWRLLCPLPGDLPWNAQLPQSIAILKRIVPKFLKFNQQVIAGSDALFRAYDLDPQLTIGVSYRGTDKHTEATVYPAEAFFPVLDQLTAANPGWKLWIKAEESAVTRTFLERYPSAVVIREFFTAAGSQSMADLVNPKPGFQKGLDIMMMLHMFSRCRALVKNASNIADLASGLSTGEIHSIVVPKKVASVFTVSATGAFPFKL